MRRIAILVGVLLLAAAAGWGWWSRRQPTAAASGVGTSLVRALGSGSPSGFRLVLGPRRLTFPRDDGPHPRYRNEWWYFTGNLRTSSGRRFGYELTFFRVALAPGRARGGSDWSGHQVYMAHLAVTDVHDRRFRYRERVSRTGPGVAGAHAPDSHHPFRVWLHSWSVTGQQPDTLFPAMLDAGDRELGVHLRLRRDKPRVLQGERGYSRKGPGRGQASYYYSFPRLKTRGDLSIGGQTFRVHGLSWMDHEWGSSVLGRSQSGWDWFALHLDDGRDFMFYRMRRRDGRPSSYSDAVLIGAQGQPRQLDARRVQLRVTGHWRSPRSGIRYPSGWLLSLPRRHLVLRVRPLLRDQELRGVVTYWEGAVSVSGHDRKGALHGRGYVELAGYASKDPGS